RPPAGDRRRRGLRAVLVVRADVAGEPRLRRGGRRLEARRGGGHGDGRRHPVEPLGRRAVVQPHRRLGHDPLRRGGHAGAGPGRRAPDRRRPGGPRPRLRWRLAVLRHVGGRRRQADVVTPTPSGTGSSGGDRDMGRLESKVAVITGAARGQGEAEARLFVAEGARVLLADIRDEEGEAVAAELGGAAAYVHLDVTDEDQWAAAIAHAEERFGPVSVLVNNAGILHFKAIDQTDREDFDRVVRVNVHGVFLGIRAVTPSMVRAGGGSIVNISSTAGLQGLPYLGAYVASKWAVRGLTKTAAMDLGPKGIRVNSVHPGG